MDSKYSSYGNGGKNGGEIFNGNNGFQIKRKPLLNGSQENNGIIKKPRNETSVVSATSTSNGDEINQSNDGSHVNNALTEQRQSLPVFSVKSRLKQEIIMESTIIIISETGSGKTTQIPQYIHEFGTGVIGVTQPRRVAAITIAKRVAQEMGCKLGDTVGYAVRFEDMTSAKTKIKYMTDGILLREALSDRLLRHYRYIILDEAHERTIDTDVLFGIVKEAQRIRREQGPFPLKIILMSATMDVDHFQNYFNDCKVIYLEGRTFPVHVKNTKVAQSDYLHASVSTFFDIHQKTPPAHDVLIFLTGQEEIETVVQQIRSISKSNNFSGPPLRVFPLYSQMPQFKQMEVFIKLSPNVRKVILSTNIAETSLTIPGIKYVIDSGMVKRRVYDPATGMETLKVVRISKAQACQRTGRAGRESEGFCYRVYTTAEFNEMDENTTPEILRTNVTSTVLQLLALGIDSQKFDFIDKPSSESVETAMKTLHQLGAVSSPKSTELTPLGIKMARFPLDPRFSKMLLASVKFECLDEMLSLIAMLSSDNVYILPNDKRELALTAHSKFDSKYGDHLKLLNVYRGFAATEKQKVWCTENYLNLRNLVYARDVRSQLLQICIRCEMEQTSCGANVDAVRKCLITGLFNNIAELHRENNYLTVTSRQRGKLHPSSTLNGKGRPECVIFNELVSTSRNFLRCVTIIKSEWVDEILPNSDVAKRMSHSNYSADGMSYIS